MKKLIIILIIIILLPFKVKADNTLLSNATNGILIETSTGTIIYEKNKDEKVSIASLTKMMSLILIFERIENGTLKYTDKVTTSSIASGMGGSQIWLETGEEMTVDEMLKGIIMASANDAVVAMAEKIGGTEENFVKMMNDKAKELNLKNTNFVNSHGLDEKNHYSSAYDLSVIATYLMKFEDVFKYTTNYEDYLRVGTDRKFWLVNTNKLIRTYNGADGLKTGMTDNAGYCMAVTAKRNGMRILAITLGEKQGKVRNAETASLLDYGFNLYKVITIKNKNDVVGEITIDKANVDKINVVVNEDVTILQKQGEIEKEYQSEVKLNNIRLPLKKNSVIGKLLVKSNDEIVKEVDITTNIDITKKSFFKLFGNIFKDILTGNLI